LDTPQRWSGVSPHTKSLISWCLQIPFGSPKIHSFGSLKSF
jgi:hypothetical protein